MSDRIYTVSFSAVAVTAAVDVFEFSPADDKPIQVLGLFMSQSSDVADAAEEILSYTVLRGHTTSGSGGTAATARPVNPSDTAAGFAAETNNTTAATAGTAVVLHAAAFNIRVGEAIWLPEGCEWGASQANTTLVVRLAAAPADSLTMSGTAYVKELG